MTKQPREEAILEKEFDKPSQQLLHTSASRRDAIMRASIHLFLEQGYSNTTVRQIAQATDTSPSLIIYHFGSKQAIAQAFLKAKMQELRSELLQLVDIRTEPELFCCTFVRLFQTIMSSPALCRFYHDMIEEGLFREFFFSSNDGINASMLILSKRNVKLPPDIANFYTHYISPSVEMALWLSADTGVPGDEKLDIPFRALMGLICVPTEEVDATCAHGREIVRRLLEEKPELASYD